MFRHFLGGKITNFDALSDYVSEENNWEFPLIDKSASSKLNKFNIADELINKFYELIHLEDEKRSIAVVGSRKDVGKTEISLRMFEKLRSKYKTYRFGLRKKV